MQPANEKAIISDQEEALKVDSTSQNNRPIWQLGYTEIGNKGI